MEKKILAEGNIDVTEQYKFNEDHGIKNDPIQFMKELNKLPKLQDNDPETPDVIDFMLVNSRHEVDGDIVAHLAPSEIEQIRALYRRYTAVHEKVTQLNFKYKSVTLRAGNLLKKMLKARNEHLEPYKTSLGISRKDGTLYIGDTKRVHADPEAPPDILRGDRVIGMLTKVENKKILELNADITELHGQIKLYQTQERDLRLELTKQYFDTFGSEYMNEIIKSGRRMPDIEFVYNVHSQNVRCRDKRGR